MKVLFVREKWSDGRKELGLSDGSFMIPTLASSGMGEAAVFYYDEPLCENADDSLLAAVDTLRPDLIVFSQLISWGDRNVKKETYRKIRDNGIKVVGVWHEGVAPDVVRAADEMADCVDFHVVLDTKAQHLQHTKYPDKYLGVYDPRDPSMFRAAGLARDKFMSFAGTVFGRVHRCYGIAALWANRIPCDIAERPQGGIAPDATADMLGRSMIGVNFADSGNGDIRHYKGRVAEVLLCGAALFERKNPEIQNILRPFIDYVEWEEYKDLIEKCYYYAQHQDELAAIAESGKRAAREKLTGREFWTAIFERAGLKQ